MKLLVSAIEVSANIHLQNLLIHKKNRKIELIGIFDKKLGNPIYDLRNMSFIGLSSIFKKLYKIFQISREMINLAEESDKILLIDSSFFNLYLAKKIKLKYPKKEIIYYILPQIWATRKGRIKKIEKYCDRLLGIIPFEIEYYSKKVEYVGHPLLDEMNLNNILEKKEAKIAYMAGSRKSEIKNLMPIFRKLAKEIKDKTSILIIPSSFTDNQIKEYYGDISEFKISRNTEESLRKVEFAFICSGTATLEAVLLATPFTLVYILSKLDFFLLNYLFKIPHIGLANIFLKKINNSILHKELIGKTIKVEELLKEYKEYNPQNFINASIEIKKYLKYGSSRKVAEIIFN